MRSLKKLRETKIPKTPKKMNMKKLFRRNQIIITTLAVMIAAAGYLNYAGKQEMASGHDVYEAGATDISDEDILAENQALTGDYQDIASLDHDPVSDGGLAADGSNADGGQLASNDVTSASNDVTSASNDKTSDDVQTGLENPGEAVLTSGMNVSDYIANVQLSREQVRARNKETLMNLINNENIEESAKQQAIQEMIDMTAVSEKENAAETLLLAKGFADPVVSMTDGKVDVVINASGITDPQRAQIEDIVKRKTEVGAENIVISLMKLEE